MSENIQELRKKAMALPLSPGVYIMKNKSGEIIYIGKAKALKNRVSQYFGSQNNHSEKVRQMVENAADFDYIITDNEFEALVLECSLIKQHKPKYNILLKDDKGYSYLKITKEPWRKISVVFQKDVDNADFFGPYKSHFALNQAFSEATNIFGIPTCNKTFPRDFKKSRPCLNYHIKQCMGTCRGKISLNEYNEAVDEALSFLRGGSNLSLKQLNEQMLEASENMEFERAAKIRDRIRALKSIQEKQKIFSQKVLEQDVITSVSDGVTTIFEVFRIRDGRLSDTESFKFALSDLEENRDENEASRKVTFGEMSEFLAQYYSMREDVPKTVTLDREIDDAEIMEKWLGEKRGGRVYVTVPKIGDQSKLVSMCKNNALEQLAQTKNSNSREFGVLEELRNILKLDKIPEYIESYDISNTAGSENVAGMVVYKNARPYKQAYRKFKIKSFEGQDDYASMAEVLERRLREYLNGAEGFSTLPDLILLDGGKGQVGAVLPILRNLKIDVPVFGMVKDDKHRTRALTTERAEVSIQSNRAVFTFVSKIQDEVHRFAIGYHKQRRSKSAFTSSLTKIDGIGEERARALLKHFRTVRRISGATLEELEKAPKMNKSAALRVFTHFNGGGD